MEIEFDTMVDEVMRRWPATIRTFLDYGMECIGCPIGRLHAVEDACREHGVDPQQFRSALLARAFGPPCGRIVEPE